MVNLIKLKNKQINNFRTYFLFNSDEKFLSVTGLELESSDSLFFSYTI